MDEEAHERRGSSLSLSPIDYVPIPQVLRLRTHNPARIRRHWKERMQSALDHWVWSLWMTILTMYALFGDDVRLAATDKESDDGFYAVSCVCLLCFTAELVLASLVKEKYVLSFYFWLDVVSSLSLIADIGWVWDLIVGREGVGRETAKTSQVLRAGRASRAGTRAARIIQVVRVIRLIRIVRLYNIAQESRVGFFKETVSGKLQRAHVSFRGADEPVAEFSSKHVLEKCVTDEDRVSASFSLKSASPSLETIKSLRPLLTDDLSNVGTIAPSFTLFRDGTQSLDYKSSWTFSEAEDSKGASDQANMPEESAVGKILFSQISKGNTLLVIGVMFMLPLFSKNLYIEDETSFLYGLRVLNRFLGSEAADFDLAWQSYIDEHLNIDTPIIYLEATGLRSWKGDINYIDLRLDEQNLVQFSGESCDVIPSQFSAVFSLQQHSRTQAGMNIARTFFICVVLAASSMIFSQDAHTMIIGPIESMVERVKRISKNPLEAAHFAHKETFVFAGMKKKAQRKEGLMETELLEKIFEKVGALLAIGFGEAGSEIIIANMKKGGGDVDPMIPGHKVECIFGFCDIRNFTDTTEVLQEDIMQFVNEIASIVHTTAYNFSGTPNKNIGDAFLLVWKFAATVNSEMIELGHLAEGHFCRQLTDMAVITLMKIWAQINRSPRTLKYRRHIPLNRRMPNYSVNMGFGLHEGWAIEGAIGSEFKIDASYLSPHVNLASRLEAATKQFGVPILASGKIYQLATSTTRSILRQIDRVAVKGSRAAIDIFTPDMSLQTLVPDDKKFALDDDHDRAALRIAMMDQREALKRAIIHDRRMVSFLYEEDSDLVELLREDMTFFKEKFKVGFEKYIKGQWLEASRAFIDAETVLGRLDGPCRTLLRFLEANGYQAPKNWLGYRELTEK